MRLLRKISPIYKIVSNQSIANRGNGQGISIFKSASLIAVNSRLISQITSYNSTLEVKSSEEFSFAEFKEKDLDEVTELLKTYYYHREPLSLMLGRSYEDRKESIGEEIKMSVEDKVSTIVRHQKSGFVVGCSLATIISRNHQRSISDKTLKTSYEAQILDMLKKSVNLFKKYNVETILHFDHTTVHPAYASHGLGGRLARGNEMRGKDAGCKLATAQATNIISQSILRKLGYTEEFSIDYSDIRIGGEQVLDLNKNLGSTSAKLFTRHL